MFDRRSCPMLLALLIAFLDPAGAAIAATFFVESLADSGPQTLRQAISDANATPGADTILFGAGLSGAILLQSGLPPIDESVDIFGPAADAVTVDAQQHERIFLFQGGSEGVYSVQGLTLTGGLPSSGRGGGVALSSGRLVLEGVRVVGNASGPSADGAGIFASPGTELVIRRSSVAQNVALGSGGGILGSHVTIDQSAIYGNTSGGNGGGVWANGALNLFESTISGNSAEVQQGLVSFGGGVYLVGGTLTVFESTIRDNEADSGPGLYASPAAVIVEVSGTIIAGNRFEDTGSEGNCNRDLGQLSRRNLSGDDSCGFTGTGDFENTDPLLAPLELAGGSTPSHVPFPSSPVIDSSLDEFCIEVDQRGFLRPVDGDGDGGAICDIGAVEYTPGLEGTVFGDGFESGDLSAWSSSVD